jgi:hypothetical protein
MTSYKTSFCPKAFLRCCRAKKLQPPEKTWQKRQRYHPVTTGSRTVEMSSMVQHCVWNSHITTDSQCNTVLTRFFASDCQFESFATLDMNYIHLSRSRLADGWDVGLSGSMRDNPKCPKMAGLKSNW